VNSLPSGAIVLLAVAATVSAFIHWRLPKYLVACGASAIVSPVVFVLVCALQAGLPPVALPHVAFFAAVSLLVSVVVGLAFLVPRTIAKHAP
jgi:hypothetical protein